MKAVYKSKSELKIVATFAILYLLIFKSKWKNIAWDKESEITN